MEFVEMKGPIRESKSGNAMLLAIMWQDAALGLNNFIAEEFKRAIDRRLAEAGIRVSLDPGAREPARAHPEDAGLDLFSPEAVKVPARGSAVIDTGVHVEIQNGYAGMIKSKSGLNIKHGIISDGVVDAGYTGSIRVKLYNLSDEDYMVELGDKISQLVIVPCATPAVVVVGSLDETERGDNGFGSTGR